jgi:hypothetical protein
VRRELALLGVAVSVTVDDPLADAAGAALAGFPGAHAPASGTAASGTGASGTGAGGAAHDVRLHGPDADGRWVLHDGGHVVASDVAEPVAVAWLLWYLNRLAAATPHFVTLHAGAVVGPHGAVVLPGAPGAGKSTITAALVSAGFGYLSDELAALDLAGERVHPFARPLGLHPRSVELLGARLDVGRATSRPGPEGGVLAAPAALQPAGSAPGEASPSRPAVVVFPRVAPGATARPAALDPADALLGLLAQAPNLAVLGAVAFRVLARLVARCGAWALDVDGLDAAVAAVAGLAAAGRAPHGGVHPLRELDAAPGDRDRGSTPHEPGLRRTPGLCAVRFGSGDVVVHDESRHVTHRLNGPAAEVYERCDGRPAAAVGAELARRYPHADVAADVAAVLARLDELGLIAGPARP